MKKQEFLKKMIENYLFFPPFSAAGRGAQESASDNLPAGNISRHLFPISCLHFQLYYSIV